MNDELADGETDDNWEDHLGQSDSAKQFFREPFLKSLEPAKNIFYQSRNNELYTKRSLA